MEEHFTLDLRNKVLSIRDEDSGATFSGTKSPLPTPKFYTEKSFSSKKEKPIQRTAKPPPTPRASSSSSIRLLSHNSSNSAQSISCRTSKSSLSSKYDSNSDISYFHQCFRVICKLGSGSFGDVFKVRSIEDGKYYAVKRSKEKFAGKLDRERKLQEAQKHEQLPSHPNCVKFYNAWEEGQRLYIQIELCKCSLSQYADENHNISENIVWNFLVDLLLAVKHLHDHNLVHLDIKPDNIFVSENGICKLGDFGLILDLSKSDFSNAIEGDPRYIAPETMQGIFTKAADVFSLGITILELASDLNLPQGEEGWHELRNLQIPEKFVKGLSLQLFRVISLMMEPDYRKRLSVHKILKLEIVELAVKQRKKSLKSTELVNKNLESCNSGISVFSDWNSSLSDDVFVNGTNGIIDPLVRFCSEKVHSFDEDVAHNNSLNNSFDTSRARFGVSTPCSFRYWDSKHDISGSPCLSGSKKKPLSPGCDNSPIFAKSPRLQLFNSSDEEEPPAILPPKNLLHIFNSL